MQSFSIVSSHQLLASERSTMPSLQEVAANRRDVEQCKIAFVGIISQILYAKHGFPSTCFQLVKSDHCHKSLQDVFSKSRGIAHFRSKYLEDSRVNVFLRRSSNPGVTKFLRILETDILPLIGTDDLAEFRLTFEESQGQGSTGLKEYFNVICKDFPNGKVDFDVWRAATGHRNLNVTGSGLLGLGVYLSRLNEWKAPARWSMSMRPKVRLDALAGLWIYDVTKPENSNTSLSQQKHYGLERAAHVKYVTYIAHFTIC
ncbi:hypothetical protein QBC38DRAFT_148473 [Podospora fimiseda]|uniref:Uncharacterized protein n=1 Tax=Podospora fimiseda TaxID=252190 RepID=A0AAN7BSI5_9PEZI|nr:hypothetical protein QBC38DRAFT_148473 [Podospora fimiseda]